MSHRYSILQILGWLMQGLYLWALDLAPIVNPPAVSHSPPYWWYHYYSSWDWYIHLQAGDIPDSTLCQYWVQGCFRLLAYWVEEVGNWAVDWAEEQVRRYTGLPDFGYTTFQAWLTAIRIVLGTGRVVWANDLVDAAYRLYLWVPARIRHGLSTWNELLSAAADVVRAWVTEKLAPLIITVTLIKALVENELRNLQAWVTGVRLVVDLFVQDPGGYITGALGPDWVRLVVFSRDCLVWYYNLKQLWGRELTAFLANPKGYLWSKLEERILELW